MWKTEVVRALVWFGNDRDLCPDHVGCIGQLVVSGEFNQVYEELDL